MTSLPHDPPARVLGFNHVNLVVADVDRSVAFYGSGLGLVVESVTPDITFMTTPGAGDSIALQRAGGPLDRAGGPDRKPGDSGAIDHLGFDVASIDLEAVLRSALSAGGVEVLRFTLPSGSETVFVTDPDGYVLQLIGREVATPPLPS